MPEDLDPDGQGGNLFDHGLSDLPGRKRIAEIPMLASLYLQAIGPMGTIGPGATGFVLRDASLAPYLITNRHVVTGQNTLDGLKVPAGTLPVSALRVAVHKTGPLGTWMPVALRLGDSEGQPYWLEHPVHGSRVDVIALPLRGLVGKGGLDLIAYPHLPPAARMVARHRTPGDRLPRRLQPGR